MTSVCNLESYPSLEDFLKDCGLSSHKIKKSHLSKKQLLSQCKKYSEIKIDNHLINPAIINCHYTGPLIPIIFEDDYILALDKPHNIFSHPLSYDEQDNVLSFLREHKRGSLLQVNQKKYDRGLIHRLDYQTSGVLIYCKDEDIYQRVRKNYHKIVQEKIYLAIVRGKVKKEGEFQNFFSVSGKNRSKMKVSAEKGEQRGSLYLESLDYNQKKNLSLIKIFLKTGIRHQIRAQLSFLGLPILGDSLYGAEKASRLFLHSHRYSLKLSPDYTYEISSEKPASFKQELQA